MVKTVIGVIGGIGSGKTTVSNMFSDLGARVYDADAACHEHLQTERIASKVARIFGKEILDRGKPDREALARIVFSNPEALRKLEEMLHSEVAKDLEGIISSMKGDEVLVIDAPLLLEADLASFCDKIIYIRTKRPIRQERMEERGWDIDEMSRRESHQISLNKKRKAAHLTIDNSGDLESTRAQVKDIWEEHILPRTGE